MLKKFLQNEYTKNLATLVSATVIAQVINFGLNLLLSRYFFGPAQYGVLSVYTAILNYISVVGCAKFDVALVAAKDREDASRLFVLGFLVLAGVTASTALLVLVNLLPGLRLYEGQEVFGWLWALPLSVFLITSSQLLWMWNVREKRFSGMSMVRIAEASANGLGAMALYFLGAMGLLFGTLFSQFISAVLLLIIVLRQEPFRNFRHSRAALKKTFRDFADFPRINILQGFMEMYQISTVIMVMSSYFGTEVAGYYSQCMRVLQMPMRLIILPVSHVFFAEASERWRKNEPLYPLVRRTALRTALFAAPVPIVLMICGPWLFSLVFTDIWREAGVFAQLMSVWVFFDLIRAPLVQVASIIGRQREILYVSVAGNVILTAVLVAGVKLGWTARWMLASISVSQALVAVILILLVFRMSKAISER